MTETMFYLDEVGDYCMQGRYWEQVLPASSTPALQLNLSSELRDGYWVT